MTWKFSAVIEEDENGYFAYCPELQGCHTQGDNIDEALLHLREAVSLYLETLTDEEKSERGSRRILTTSMEFIAGG